MKKIYEVDVFCSECFTAYSTVRGDSWDDAHDKADRMREEHRCRKCGGILDEQPVMIQTRCGG